MARAPVGRHDRVTQRLQIVMQNNVVTRALVTRVQGQTEMKSYAKTLPGSVFVVDRRQGTDGEDRHPECNR